MTNIINTICPVPQMERYEHEFLYSLKTKFQFSDTVTALGLKMFVMQVRDHIENHSDKEILETFLENDYLMKALEKIGLSMSKTETEEFYELDDFEATEINDKETYELNVAANIDNAILRILSKVPKTYDNNIRINNFGYVEYYDVGEIWQILLYIGNVSFANGIINYDVFAKNLEKYSKTYHIIKDILNPSLRNEYNEISKVGAALDLKNKLLSTIARPIISFVNLIADSYNDNTVLSRYVSNELSIYNYKQSVVKEVQTNVILSLEKGGKSVITRNINGQFIWDKNVLKDYVEEKKQFYYVIKKDKLVELNKQLGITAYLGGSENYVATLTTKLNRILKDNADTEFSTSFYTGSLNTELNKQRKAKIEKLALSFITQSNKKLYAALNTTHQIRMQRLYRGAGLFLDEQVTLGYKNQILDLAKKDPTLKFLPYITFIKKTDKDITARMLLNNTYSVLDSINNNGLIEDPNETNPIDLLKYRLLLSAPTDLTFKGDIIAIDPNKRYASFPFMSVTNSSNKTIKIVDGIEYVTGFDNKGEPIFIPHITFETTIVYSELNRLIRYTNKFIQLANQSTREVEIYSKNGWFSKALNMFFLTSNMQKEMNKLMFRTVEDSIMFQEYKNTKLGKSLSYFLNDDYFTIENGKVVIKKDKQDELLSKLNEIYTTQINLEIDHLRKEIFDTGLYNKTGDTLSAILPFLPAEYIYNRLKNTEYSVVYPKILNDKKVKKVDRQLKLLFALMSILNLKRIGNFTLYETLTQLINEDEVRDSYKDLFLLVKKVRKQEEIEDMNVYFEEDFDGMPTKISWYEKSFLESQNISLNEPLTYSKLLPLVSNINKLLNYNRTTDLFAYQVIKNEEGYYQLAEINDNEKTAQRIVNDYLKWYHYNYIFNMYDDLQITAGDMISYYKKSKKDMWSVEDTFTNFFKRAKMFISPIVPHQDNVTINNKTFTSFKNIIIKSKVTVSPQVRETTINLNREIFSNPNLNQNIRLLTYLFGNYVDLNSMNSNIYAYNNSLSANEQRLANKNFINYYNNPNAKSFIDNIFEDLGVDTSYFKVDLTDAYDVCTLTFEIKRLLLYNTNKSVMTERFATLLWNWLHEEVEGTVNIFGIEYPEIKNLRKYTNYNLSDFHNILIKMRVASLIAEYDNLMLYLRKDITVGFLEDNNLENRTLFTDKNATRILLPTNVNGTPLDMLRVFMEVHDIDRASHDSAIKMTTSNTYPIDYWSIVEKETDAKKIWQSLKKEVEGNVLIIPFSHIGEQTAQTHSNKSILSSQSKSLIFTGQKNVKFTHRYVNGIYTEIEEHTGEDVYDVLQEHWGKIYKKKFQDFINETYINGNVNTTKLINFITKSLLSNNSLREEDVKSLLTNKELLIEELIAAGRNDLADTINKKNLTDTEKAGLLYEIIESKIKNQGFTNVAQFDNWLLQLVVPIFYNTNSGKIESLFTSSINNLLKLKSSGVKGALTPNVDIVETKFITGDLLSSLVIVDPNDWTPDMELQSTSIRENKVTPDQIAVSWNFKGYREYFYAANSKDLLSNNYSAVSWELNEENTQIVEDKGDTKFVNNITYPAFKEQIHQKKVKLYLDNDGKVLYYVLYKQKEELLDILDFCKPLNESHNISNPNNNKKITYPVLDLKRLPKNILQGFANRIPTQSPNSMSYFQIVGFFDKKVQSTVAAPAEFIVRMGSDFDIDTLYSLIYSSRYNTKSSKFVMYTDEKNKETTYNRVLDIYITIMSNPANLPLILAPLDFGISKGENIPTSKEEVLRKLNIINTEDELRNYLYSHGTANIIYELSKSSKFTYNPLSALTNHLKYVSALSSQRGIGWSALHQVFNTLLELKGKDVFVNLTYRPVLFDMNNNPIQLNKYINVSQLVTTLQKSNLKGLDRSTFVSIFVDDEKEQIANRTNMSKFTLTAIAGLNAMGLDIAHIQAIISTPAIKELEKNITNLGYKQGWNKTLYDNNSTFVEEVDGRYETTKPIEELLAEDTSEIKTSFTIKDLLLYIGNNNEEQKLALEILYLFYEANRLGAELSKIQVLLNTDAAGAGKNYTSVVSKYKKIEDIFEEKLVSNILSVFGSTYYINYIPSMRIYDTINHKYNQIYDAISAIYQGMVVDNRIKFIVDSKTIEIESNNDNINDPIKSVNYVLETIGKQEYSKNYFTLFNVLIDIKQFTEVNVDDLLIYLLKSNRYKPFEFTENQMENLIKEVSLRYNTKEVSVIKEMLEGISNNKDNIFVSNLLFTPTSHKGYALLGLKLGVDTFRQFFPYGTSKWQNMLQTILKHTGKNLAREEDVNEFKKLYRAYNLLSQNFIDNNLLKDKNLYSKYKYLLDSLITLNKDLYDTYFFLANIDMFLEKDNVIIVYDTPVNLVDEDRQLNTVLNRFSQMLQDETTVTFTKNNKEHTVSMKELAEYFALYYMTVNGGNFSYRNLGNVISTDYLVRSSLAQQLSNIDYDSINYVEDYTNNMRLIAFILQHNPKLLATKYISQYGKNIKSFYGGKYLEKTDKDIQNFPSIAIDNKSGTAYVLVSIEGKEVRNELVNILFDYRPIDNKLEIKETDGKLVGYYRKVELLGMNTKGVTVYNKSTVKYNPTAKTVNIEMYNIYLEDLGDIFNRNINNTNLNIKQALVYEILVKLNNQEKIDELMANPENYNEIASSLNIVIDKKQNSLLKKLLLTILEDENNKDLLNTLLSTKGKTLVNISVNGSDLGVWSNLFVELLTEIRDEKLLLLDKQQEDVSETIMQQNPEYEKALTEVEARPNTQYIPQNLQSGVEQYGTLQYANEEAQKLLGKNVTSIELIENRFRSRTTRTDKELEKYNIKVGDYTKMFGTDQYGNTKNVIIKITKITKGYDDTTWYKEGWTEEGLGKLKAHTNSANAVEFEVVPKYKQSIETVTDSDLPKTISELHKNPNFKKLGIKGLNKGAEKDTIKMNLGNKLISFGEKGASYEYGLQAKLTGSLNPDTYSSDDIVNITVNGNNRPNQAENVLKTKQEILKAASQGVNYFIADEKEYASKGHNSNGEGEIARWFIEDLPKLGYQVKYASAYDNKVGIYQVVKIQEKEEAVSIAFDSERQKKIVIPKGADKNNTVISEDDSNIYLMTNDQQIAYDNIKQFVKDKIKNPSKIVSNEETVTFSSPLTRDYSGIIPKSFYDNFIGLQGYGGTGKTTMIYKVISDIKEENEKKFKRLNVRYLAPTHIAATMLQESLGIDSESTETVNTFAIYFKSEAVDSDNIYNEVIFKPAPEEDYIRSLKYRDAVGSPDVIIVDESSMFSVDTMKLFIERLQTDFNEGEIDRYPVVIFMGDYHQLSLEQKSSTKLGIVSSTVLRNKNKSFELKQMMRTKNEDMQTLFLTISKEIDKYLDNMDNNVPYTINYTNILEFLKKSYDNILSLENTNENVNDLIDEYVEFLSKNNFPDGMFYLHYNKIDHPTTKNISKKIREKYLKSIGKEYSDKIVEGDYVVYNYGKLIHTKPAIIKAELVNPYVFSHESVQNYGKSVQFGIGTLKPKSRYKVIQSIDNFKETLNNILDTTTAGYKNHEKSINELFGKGLIELDGKILLNRQGRLRCFISIKGLQFVSSTTYYAINNKGNKVPIGLNTVLDYNGNRTTFSVTFQEESEGLGIGFLLSMTENSRLSFNNLFAHSYIGSTHSFQGAGIENTIVGASDIIKYANTNTVHPLDIITSLYTAVTRAKSSLAIIVQQKTNIEGFKGYTQENQVFTPFEEIETKLNNTKTDLISVSVKDINTIQKPLLKATKFTKENPLVIYVDGSDVNSGEDRHVGYGIHAEVDGKHYNYSFATTAKTFKENNELTSEIEVKAKYNDVMEAIGTLKALEVTPSNVHVEIRQDYQTLMAAVIAKIIAKEGSYTGNSKKYADWFKSLPKQQQLDLYNKTLSLVNFNDALIANIRRANWEDGVNYEPNSKGVETYLFEGTKGQYPKDAVLNEISDKVVEIIYDRQGKIKMSWVQGHKGERGNVIADKIARDTNNYDNFTVLFDSVKAGSIADILRKDNKSDQFENCG